VTRIAPTLDQAGCVDPAPWPAPTLLGTPTPRAQCAASMGAGDVLMSFLGVVIISMGFRIYQQRDTMKRHAPEIVGATLLSSLFSFFSTAFAAKALGLSAGA